MNTRDLKPNPFTLKKMIDQEALSKLLQKVQGSFPKVENRTQMKSEMTKMSFPRPFSFPEPFRRLKITQISSIENTLPAQAIGGVDPDRMQFLFDSVAPLGRVVFDLSCRAKSGDEIGVSLFLENNSCTIGFNNGGIRQKLKEPPEEWITKLLNTASLPAEVRKKKGSGYDIVHTQGGQVRITDFEPTAEPLCPFISLPNDSPGGALERLKKFAQTKTLTAYTFSYTVVMEKHLACGVSVEDALKALSRASLPGKDFEVWFLWSLPHFRDFSLMTEVAEAVRESVAQSLLHFDIKQGVQGQIDVAADEQGRFKVWLSFDKPEYAKLAEKELGIALVAGH